MPVTGAHARIRPRAAAVALLTMLLLAALVPAGARAGEWIQVSCVNPNGSASNAEGWSGSSVGTAINTTSASSCGPGNPLYAEQQYNLGPTPQTGSSATITYSPPPGSMLAGGSLDAALAAYGYGQGSGQFSLALVMANGTALKTVGCPGAGCTGNTFSGAVTIPADTGGVVAVGAGCATLNEPGSCANGEQNGVYDRAAVSSADLLLRTDAEPQASGFRGSALQRNASGTASVVLAASDPAGGGANAPSGPGIYAAAVLVDGRTRWSGTPNANGGSCVPVGGGNRQPLMFDGQQPCPPAETLDVPVPTRGLPDGRHQLAVTLEDAAGDTATVLDQYISTYNPQITPLPKGRAVKARFVLSWHWSGATTRLRSVVARHLPRTAAIALSCRGRGCPRLAHHATGARPVKRLLRALAGRRFRAGDRLFLTVTAPGHRRERIVLRIRNGKIPAAKLI